MDTNQLQAFLSVAKSGSFSSAAEGLHLTQPAISKRIMVLESSLGAKLFDRIGKRVLLTEAGNLLLPRAEQLLQELEDSRRSIQNLSQGISGRLALASSHHIGLHRLPPVLRSFTRGYPDVTIDISFLDSERAYAAVLQGEIELAVVTLAPLKVDRIESHPLWPDPMAFMVGVEHPLAAQKPITLAALLQHPAILPAPATFTRQLVEKMFQQQRLQLEIEMSTNYLETIKMLVSVGMAWSVLPCSMHDTTLRILPVEGIQLERTLGYIYHRSRTLSNAAQAFIGMLEKHRTE